MVKLPRQLSNLSCSELLLLPQFLAGALLVALGLRWASLPRLVSWLVRGAGNRHLRNLPFPHRHCEVSRLVVIADLVSPLVTIQGACLTRSLLLFWLFRARGEPAELKVGISRDDNTVFGHAWIEQQGKVCFDEPATGEKFVTVFHS